MVKENELRKGNYIYYEKTTHIVDGILNGKIYSHWIGAEKHPVSNDYVCDISEIELIPLTEYWLLKFGFEISEGSSHNGIWGCFKNGMEIFEEAENEQYFFIFGNSEKYFSNIHELQNIFFALCGEELVFSTEP